MSETFLAEIRIFAGNFAPRGWALCNGQLLPIAQNTALFSLLGTQYGGNGQTTFALPNLSDSVPIGSGQGPGLTDRSQGEVGGSESVTLLNNEIPSHTHTPSVGSAAGSSADPTNAVWTVPPGRRPVAAYGGVTNTVSMYTMAIQPAGASQPHNNMQPYLALNFIIALEGIFPSRS
jgi:microcystin-dependent protein